MTTHYREDLYLDKLINQKFSGSFMSNSKWVKLISTLVIHSCEIKECKVKPVWDDKEPFRKLLFNENTQYNFDYYDTAMEGMVSEKPTGFYAYKEIEWLDFPLYIFGSNDASPIKQNIQFIKSLIDSLGQFRIELSDDNLRLYAYIE